MQEVCPLWLGVSCLMVGGCGGMLGSGSRAIKEVRVSTSSMVEARRRVREARVRLEEERRARVKEVDAKVGEFLKAQVAVESATRAVEEAKERLRKSEGDVADALADVVDVEPDDETVAVLTEASEKDIAAARGLARKRRESTPKEASSAQTPAEAGAE